MSDIVRDESDSLNIYTDRLRVRVSHKYLTKEGYRHETTVEVIGPLYDTVGVGGVLEHWLGESDRLGNIENVKRNARDGRAA